MTSQERFSERAARKQKRRKQKKLKFEDENMNSSAKNDTQQESTVDEAITSLLGDEDLFKQAVLDHAVALGMDPEEDKEFLWIAEKALTAELPPDWELGKIVSLYKWISPSHV